MIINEQGSWMVFDEYPNSNWTGDDSYYVIDDSSELAERIMTYSNVKPIIENGVVLDIEILPKKEVEEIEKPVTIETIKKELDEQKKRSEKLAKQLEIANNVLEELVFSDVDDLDI